MDTIDKLNTAGAIDTMNAVARSVKRYSQAGNVRLHLSGHSDDELFHALGVIIRLAETGMLTSIDAIASSDTSILIAVLAAMQWQRIVTQTGPDFATYSRKRSDYPATHLSTKQHVRRGDSWSIDRDCHYPDEVRRRAVGSCLKRWLLDPIAAFVRARAQRRGINTSLAAALAVVGLTGHTCLLDPGAPSIILIQPRPGARDHAVSMDDVYRWLPSYPCADVLTAFLGNGGSSV